MTPVVVAMFGISGVGKSSLAKAVAAARPSITHLQASALLRKETKRSDDQLRHADDTTFENNQDALVRAFWRVAEQSALVLFDGHSLIDTDKAIVDIPNRVIVALKPSHIVFVAADAEKIAERRKQDPTKHRPFRSPADLEAQQRRALKNAQGYAADAGVDISIVSAEDVAAVLALFPL